MIGKIIKWVLNEEDMEHIVDTISLVEKPAIKVGWKYFNESYGKEIKLSSEEMDDFIVQHLFAEEQEKSYTFDVPQERFEGLRGSNLIVAPAMIANKLIFQIDDDGVPYYGYFDETSIRNAAYMFQKLKLSDQFTLNHNDKQVADGVYLAETWLVQDTELDKSNYYGYRLPPGSWMTTLRVENKELFSEWVTSGKLNGLSVEAFVLEKVILNNLKTK